jgi:hypothetical protein
MFLKFTTKILVYEKMLQLMRSYRERSLTTQKFDRDRDKLITKAAFVKVVFTRRFRIFRCFVFSELFWLRKTSWSQCHYAFSQGQSWLIAHDYMNLNQMLIQVMRWILQNVFVNFQINLIRKSHFYLVNNRVRTRTLIRKFEIILFWQRVFVMKS